MLLSTLLMFVASQSTLTPVLTSDLPEELVVLVCPVTGQTERTSFDFTINLDFASSTANGWKAEITDGEVRWEGGSDNNSPGNRYVLNRYTGSLVFGTRAFPTLYSGQCKLQTKRMF